MVLLGVLGCLGGGFSLFESTGSRPRKIGSVVYTLVQNCICTCLEILVNKFPTFAVHGYMARNFECLVVDVVDVVNLFG